jgi:hypothetical protein
MQTFLVVLSIWLLINVLFAVIMMPPRKPQKPDRPRSQEGLAPIAIEGNAYPFDEDDKVSLRHTIIAIAMGALFSLTPPLLQAADDIKRLVRKYCKSGPPPGAAASERSLETILEEVRAGEVRQQTDVSPSDARDEPKR